MNAVRYKHTSKYPQMVYKVERSSKCLTLPICLAMGDFGNSNLPAFPGLPTVVRHLSKVFSLLENFSTREFHMNTNMLNYYVFKCIPCMYDNINK